MGGGLVLVPRPGYVIRWRSNAKRRKDNEETATNTFICGNTNELESESISLCLATTSIPGEHVHSFQVSNYPYMKIVSHALS